MGFFGMFNVYTMRTNLSIAIVAMVNSTSDDEQSNSSCPDRGVSEINDVSNVSRPISFFYLFSKNSDTFIYTLSLND